jgi:hypothetical protein
MNYIIAFLFIVVVVTAINSMTPATTEVENRPISDLSNFQRMSKPRSMKVAFPRPHDLGLNNAT